MASIDSLCVLGQSIALSEGKQKTAPVAKGKVMKNKPVEKVFTATGQAPSPSKDFFELVVAKDRIIWRVWRIKYKNHRMIMPSEDTLSYEDYQYDGRVQTEIDKNLGDDVLQISLAYASKQWLARMPMKVLLQIASYLTVKDISSLAQVRFGFILFRRHLYRNGGIGGSGAEDFRSTGARASRVHEQGTFGLDFPFYQLFPLRYMPLSRLFAPPYFSAPPTSSDFSKVLNISSV